MQNYKVLVEFEIDGVAKKVDSVLELSEEAAKDFVADGIVALVSENGEGEGDKNPEQVQTPPPPVGGSAGGSGGSPPTTGTDSASGGDAGVATGNDSTPEANKEGDAKHDA